MPNKEVHKQNPEGDSINEPNLDQEQPDQESGSDNSPKTVVDPETPHNLFDKKDNLNFDVKRIEPF